MQQDRIAALLGLPATDPRVERLLADAHMLRRPALETDHDGDILGTQDWLLNAALGVEFGFDEPASFLGGHPDDIGAAPMILTQIYFYGDHENVQPYRGLLPFGAALSDGRDMLRERMAGFEATRRSWIRDVWEAPRFRVVAQYAEGGLGFLLCTLRPPPLPADAEDAARLPGAERILAQLGRPLGDPELRLALAPLQVPASLVAREGELLGDWRLRFGLELRFGPLAGGRENVLTTAEFYAAHAGGAIGWPGTLPFGMTFADSPEVIVARVGRPPDEREEEDFHGSVSWTLPAGELLAEYNSMENLLVRVRVLAPGME